MTKVLIIESSYYADIAHLLLVGATAILAKAKISYDVITVPGVLEIPAALKFSFTKTPYDAYIVLGCVIRGETSHYEIVCQESARKIYDLVMTHDLALGNGILTVETENQAITRASPAQKNKGGEAAKAALSLSKLKN